jgi:hypothetical protein
MQHIYHPLWRKNVGVMMVQDFIHSSDPAMMRACKAYTSTVSFMPQESGYELIAAERMGCRTIEEAVMKDPGHHFLLIKKVIFPHLTCAVSIVASCLSIDLGVFHRLWWGIFHTDCIVFPLCKFLEENRWLQLGKWGGGEGGGAGSKILDLGISRIVFLRQFACRLGSQVLMLDSCTGTVHCKEANLPAYQQGGEEGYLCCVPPYLHLDRVVPAR